MNTKLLNKYWKYSGVASYAVFLLATLAAWAVSDFDFTQPVALISDLGAYASAPAPLIFNLGAVISGALLITFALFIRREWALKWRNPSFVFWVISGLGIAGIGLFPLPVPFDPDSIIRAIHWVFAIAAMVGMAASFVTLPLIKHLNQKYTLSFLGVGFVAVILGIILYENDLTILVELMSIFINGAWVLSTTIWLDELKNSGN